MAEYIRDLNRILAEELLAMPPSQRRVAPSPDGGQFIDVGRTACVKLACEIMRKGWSRADAVEMAFDRLLADGNGQQWKRTGEVALLNNELVARAFCSREE